MATKTKKGLALKRKTKLARKGLPSGVLRNRVMLRLGVLNMSTGELARSEKSDFTIQALGAWLRRGEWQVTVRSVYRLAKALGIDDYTLLIRPGPHPQGLFYVEEPRDA